MARVVHGAAALTRSERGILWVAVAALIASSFAVVSRSRPEAVAAETYALQVSSAADRSDPAPLDGQTVSGDVYVFTSPDAGVSRVTFFLDDPEMTGSPHQTENYGPYDFAGTASDGTAFPFDTATIPDGDHTITAEIAKTDGTSEVLNGVFTVSNTAPALSFDPSGIDLATESGGTASGTSTLGTTDGTATSFTVTDDTDWLTVDPTSGTTPATLTFTADASNLGPGTYTATVTGSASGYTSDQATVTLTVTGYSLMVSTSADRSSPAALDGSVASGDVHVFTSPDDGVKRVRFYLDDTGRSGSPHQTENRAPYDFEGTASDGTALPFDTTTIADGEHTITASIDRTDGGNEVLHAAFTVSNQSAALAFDPDSLAFSQERDRTSSQTASLATTDGAASPFSVNDDAAWLAVEPTSGTAPADLTLTADSTGLDPGTYTATVTATAEGYDPGTLTVELTVTNPCGHVACEDVLVDLPYELDFASDHGMIADGNGTGTGFTWIDEPTNGTGYVPANLDVDQVSDVLAVNTTSGINFRDVDSLDNGLAVGVDPRDQLTVMSATIQDPPVGAGNFEQGGVWFGNDEDDYVKLVVLSTPDGPVIEFFMEVGGADAAKKRTGTLLLGESAVELIIRADPTDHTVEASYSVDGGTPTFIGAFVAPEEFFSFDGARIDPRIGTDSFAGILTTHRNGPEPIVYHFDAFAVTGEALTTTPGAQPFPFVQRSVSVPMPTSMVWGPDGRLYVTEAFGTIHRLTFDDDWNLVSDQPVATLGSRLALGVTVDPDSTPEDVILWVAHSEGTFFDAPPDTSVVSKLTGPNLGTREDVITGLPRSEANHAINSLHFGPDGRLYIASGGNTGAGAPNEEDTEFGQRGEQPLSAAIIVADVKASGFDGSCHNADDIYGPPPCDVTPFATGLRNIYDFVFHSNGNLYGPDNGLGVTGTFPPTPTPPCDGFGDTRSYTEGGHNPGSQPDTFHLIEEGAYYGHPNPSRDECVFNDGSYQGVDPLPDYVLPMFVLGDHRSANGTIEYAADRFAGQLQGTILITNYAVGDDVTMVRLSEDGRQVTEATSLVGGFDDPLPIAQAPDGTLFVGEFGSKEVTVLVPDDDLGSWTSKTAMPESILDAGGEALDGKLYSVAGKTEAGPVSSVRIYDPATDSWTTGPDLPGPAVENPALVASGGKLYAFGGSTDPFSGAVSDAAVYDPATGVWTVLPPMPTPRGGATAEAVNGDIYVIGGMDGTGASVATVEVFDTSTGTWSAGTPLPTRRDNPGSAVLDGDIYVFGGRARNADGSGLAELDVVEAYDPAADAWTAKAPMPTGRRTFVVGTLNGRAQVMGGEKRPDGGSFAANEEYDPVTDTWRVLAPMQTPRHGAAAGTISGVVYVAGGGPVGGSSFTDVTEAFSFGG